MINSLLLKLKRFQEKVSTPLIALLLLAVLASLPSLFTFNDYKKQISKQFTEQTGFDMQIEGDVGFKLLPYPTITLSQVRITKDEKKKIVANIIRIFPSLIKLFQGHIEPVQISFNNAEMVVANLGNYITSSKAIPVIQFNNSSLTFEDSELMSSIKDLNATITHSKEQADQIQVHSSFLLGEQNWFLTADFGNINAAGDSDDVKFSFGNKNFAIDFGGKVTQFFTEPKLDGNLKLNLNALQNQQSDTLLNKILQNEKLNFEGKLLFNPEVFKISNLKLSSKNIKNSYGEIEYLIKDQNELSADFSIEEINIGELFNGIDSDFNNAETFKTTIKFLLDSFNFNIPNTINGSVHFSVDKLRYDNDAFEDLIFRLDILGKEILLDQLSVKIPKDSKLTINGVIKHNGIRPKFEGNAYLVIEDLPYFSKWMKLVDSSEDLSLNRLELKSQMSFIPQNLHLSNIQASLGNILVNGRGTLKHTGDGNLNAKLITRVNELDANAFKLPQSVDNFILQLFLHDADKSGEKFIAAVNDYRWLRRFPINLYFELLADTIQYKNTNFNKFLSTFRIYPNNLAIDRIEAQSDVLTFGGLLNMKLTAIKPEISADFEFNKLNTNVISALFPSIASLRQYQSDLYKKPDAAQKFNLPELTIIPEINFFSLHNFDIKLKTKINELVSDTSTFNNISLDSYLDDGVITFNDISGDIFNGKLKGIGNIVIITPIPSFSFSYGINNFDPSSLLKFFTGYDGITGYMSVNGNISTTGNLFKNIYNKLYGTLKVAGKKIKIRAFDLGELIRITESDLSLASKFERLKYYSENGESLFDDLSADAEINAGVVYIKQAKIKNNRANAIFVAAYDLQSNVVNGLTQISFIPIGSYSPLNISTTNQGQLNTQTFAMNTSKIAEYISKQNDMLLKGQKTPGTLLKK